MRASWGALRGERPRVLPLRLRLAIAVVLLQIALHVLFAL